MHLGTIFGIFKAAVKKDFSTIYVDKIAPISYN
jgi:hypothetical protein